MKYCKYCKTTIDTTNDFCPLCFNHVEETDSNVDQLYTLRRTNDLEDRRKQFITKLFLFLSVCAIVICFFINYLVNFDVQWCLVVTFGILYVWVLVAHTVMSQQSAFKKILLQIISIIVLLYFTERVSDNHNWLLQYVYPSISFTVVFVLLMILFIGRNRSTNILGFTVIIVLLGIVSIILIVFDFVSEFTLLNRMNYLLCGLTVLGLLIFGLRSIKQELSKKLHL